MRERAKFDFTQNLSEAMSLIEYVGADNGFNLEDLSFLNIRSFRELYISAAHTKEVLSESIRTGKAEYEETLKLSLPPLITKPDDVYSFAWPKTEPNYITQKKVTAPITTSLKEKRFLIKLYAFQMRILVMTGYFHTQLLDL